MSGLKRLGAMVGAFTALATALLLAAGPGTAAPAPYKTGNTPVCSVSATVVPVGATITITCTDVPPGHNLSNDLHTVVYHLGDMTANASGVASRSLTLPAGVSGQHTLVVTDLTAGQQIASIGLTIGGSGVGGTSAGNGGGGGLASTGVAVIGFSVLGLALVAGGVGMLLAGRRRSSSTALHS